MIRFAKYVGVNTDYLTAQAFIFPKNIPVEDALDKPLVALIICASGEDVFTKVRQSSIMVEELIFSSEPITSTLGKVLDYLTQQLKSADNLQILIACAKQDIVYLQLKGSQKVFLLRGQKLSELTSSLVQGHLISGYIKDGDRLLLINSKIDGNEVNSEDVKEFYDNKQIEVLIKSPLENFEENAEDQLKDSQHLEPVAAILLDNFSENLLNADQSLDQDKHPAFYFQKLTEKWSYLKQIGNRKARILLISAAVIILMSFLGGGVFLGIQVFTRQSEKSQVDQTVSDTLDQQQKQEDVYQIDNWPLFLSLDLIKDGFNASKLSYSLGKILLLDQSNKTLVTVDLKNKNPQILAGSVQLGGAKFASLNGDQVLVFSEDKGVLKVDTLSKKVVTVAKVDSEWGSITDIIGFGSNIYLLDQTNNQIFKYTPVEGGYSNKINYIKDGQKIEFSGAKKLQIDYSVWVLKSGASIDKFTAGSLDYFNIGGLDKPLKEIRSFFPTEEADTIYFLDPQNQRIVVTKKNGEYISQYKGEKFSRADDFIIDEEGKKMYLLEGGKIYQVELK